MRCALLILCLASPAALARAPDFPPPDDADVSMVSDNLTVQGRNMSVRAFISRDSVEEVVNFYKELWADPPSPKAPGYAYEPDAIAPWHLVTRVEDGFVMTVQVQEHQLDGSYGYLALGRLPDPGDGPATLPQPPAMKGSRVLSNVKTDDGGKDAQTSMIANSHSMDSNLNFYRERYSGWRKDIDQSMGHGTLHALSFRRGRKQVTITIASDADGSQIVVNSVKHDLL